MSRFLSRVRATLLAWLSVVLFSGAVSSRAADRTSPVPIAPPADWVEQVDVSREAFTAADPAGFVVNFLLIHGQDHVPEQASYQRRVYRITNESGLQPGAQLSWEFDPGYQQLTVHHVRVIRGGEVLDRLATANIQLIRQERDFDRHLLNGRQTAFIFLDDVRVGDVIDHAVTTKGWPPFLGGRYILNTSFIFPWPVQHYRRRIDTAADRLPIQRAKGEVLPPTVLREGDRVSLIWDGAGGKPVQAEAEQPGWFDPYEGLSLSEFSRWEDVVALLVPLYKVPDVIEPALTAKAAELVRGVETDDAKALAILQFVQQKVRYLGVHLSGDGWRPNPPAEVLTRRFGDCKDKAVLFCTLMRAAGLTAYPALVHTGVRRKLDERLPNPCAFDHAIVCIPTAEGGRWADPTLTSQAGGFERRGLPEYERALILRPGEKALAVVEVPAAAKPRTVVTEHFDSPAFDQPVTLEVVTRCTGAYADSRRAQFAASTVEAITRGAANFYASVYPGLTSTKPMTWTDDREQNTFTFTESYSIPGFWTQREDGRYYGSFDPKIVSQYCAVPRAPVRSTPLSVGYPSDITLTITARLPRNWSIKRNETLKEGVAFRAFKSIEAKAHNLKIHYEWKTMADHVPLEALAEHTRKLAEFNQSIKYTLNWKDPEKKAKKKRGKG